ncbi:hypothetical protein HG531_010368 [Fusarium graminearum]|nr:hypothetical protein HG531_010368 [Fusarium graminearum]
MLLGAVQRLKESHNVALVSLACGSKARLVHAVVDAAVLPLMRLLNLLLQVLGVQLDGLVLLVQKVVKLGQVSYHNSKDGCTFETTYLGTQHAEDLTALIAHNSVCLHIVEDWHRVSAIVVLLTLKVHILQVRKALMALDGVRHDILTRNALVLGHESPAALTKVPVNDGI